MDALIAIGQGAGLAVACGLAAFLPLGLGALAAVLGLLPGRLGVYDDTPIVIVAWVLGLAQVTVVTLLPPRVRLALAAIGGAAVFELAAGDELPWVGLLLGAVLGGVAGWLASRVLEGAARGGGTASGLAVLVGGAALGVAAVAVAPIVGYALVAALAWFVIRVRRGGQRKYAGLRVLR
jgi:hypothetical protein